MRRYFYYILHTEMSMKIYIFMWGMVGFSSFGLQAVLLNLYLVHLGFDTASIGRFLAAAQICFGFAALPAGVIGARCGPRNGLLTGTALVSAGWALFTLAESAPSGWMAVTLQMGLILANMGQATMIVNGAPYLMCITDETNRFYYLSIQQAFQALLGLTGGFIGGALPGVMAGLSNHGRGDAEYYRYVLGLIPVVFAAAFICLLRARVVHLQPAAQDGSNAAYGPSRFPKIVFAVYPIIVFLAIVGDFGSRNFFNLYLVKLGLETRQIGLMFGLNQLAPFITALAIPGILNRIGTGRTFSAGAIMLSGALLFLSISTGLAGAAVGFFLMALMATVLQATRSLFGQELVEARWRTFIAAAGTISMSLGSASSSILAGSVIPSLGFHALFRISAALVFLSGLTALMYLKIHNRYRAREQATGRTSSMLQR